MAAAEGLFLPELRKHFRKRNDNNDNICCVEGGKKTTMQQAKTRKRRRKKGNPGVIGVPRGTFFFLEQDFFALPKGIYRYEGAAGGFVQLSVGRARVNVAGPVFGKLKRLAEKHHRFTQEEETKFELLSAKLMSKLTERVKCDLLC